MTRLCLKLRYLNQRKIIVLLKNWVVWDNEDEGNGLEKIFPSKQNKELDQSWQKEATYRIINQ